MNDFPNERVVTPNCKYSFVMVVAKRAKKLRREAKDKNVSLSEIATVKTTHTKPLTIALQEFNAGNIKMKLSLAAQELEKKAEPIELKAPEEEKTEASEEAPQEPETPAETK